MANNLAIPMDALKGTSLLSLSAEPPRQVFLYEDKKRTDKPRLSEVTGRPLFRFKGLLKLSATTAEEVSLLLDSDAPLPLLQEIPLDFGRSVLGVRPEDEFSLILTVTGTLRADKGGA
ncbi:hypothetical protein AB1K54_07880 [Microbacterium sp. BWT-B31]|uniref:hypothetical protein n=1 Tax=Microbacterium sp. BWT-B31 TaxID=3232072 RepID=UPI003528A8CD